MRRQFVVWGVFGCVVALCWAIVSLTVRISAELTLWRLAQVSCPIVPISIALHFGLKWYWVLVTNFAVYGVVGVALNALWSSRWAVRNQRHVRVLS